MVLAHLGWGDLVPKALFSILWDLSKYLQDFFMLIITFSAVSQNSWIPENVCISVSKISWEQEEETPVYQQTLTAFKMT